MADVKTDDRDMFRPQGLSRLRSADDLDAYIQVTSPSGWVVLLAAFFFLMGVIVWANTAQIPTTRTFSGLLWERDVVAWVDYDTLQDVQDGNTALTIAGIRAKLTGYESSPVSESEIYSMLGSDYMSEASTTFNWNYLVYAELEKDLDRLDISDNLSPLREIEDAVTTGIDETLTEVIGTDEGAPAGTDGTAATDATTSTDAEAAVKADIDAEAAKQADTDADVETAKKDDADEGKGDTDQEKSDAEAKADTDSDTEDTDDETEDFSVYDMRLVPVEITTSETHPIRLVFGEQ